MIKGTESLTSFKQAIFFKEEVGFNIHDTMIFQKINPTPQKQPRYQPCFEYMFVLSKGKPKTVNLLQEVCKNAGKKADLRTFRHNNSDTLSSLHGIGKEYKETKPRTNIWSYSVGTDKFNRSRSKKHPAVFPLLLAEDHIRSWSNEGDLILDPFAGSGTVGQAAKNLNRDYILMEKNKDYYEMIVERLN